MPIISKLEITDLKMLELANILKNSGVIRYRKEFCNAVGIETQNWFNIKNGTRRFTVDQIQNACNIYNVNPAWIFGYDAKVFRQKNE